MDNTLLKPTFLPGALAAAGGESAQSADHPYARLVLSEVQSAQVLAALKKARLLFSIGKANVLPTFPAALTRSGQLLADQPA